MLKVRRVSQTCWSFALIPLNRKRKTKSGSNFMNFEGDTLIHVAIRSFLFVPESFLWKVATNYGSLYWCFMFHAFCMLCVLVVFKQLY